MAQEKKRQLRTVLQTCPEKVAIRGAGKICPALRIPANRLFFRLVPDPRIARCCKQQAPGSYKLMRPNGYAKDVLLSSRRHTAPDRQTSLRQTACAKEKTLRNDAAHG